MNNQKTLEQAKRVEELLRRFDASEDERAKLDAAELVRALMNIHAAGLTRVVDLLANEGQPGAEMLKKLAADETISGLLVLYGLHPVSLSARVRAVIAELQPMLNSQKAQLEYVSISEGRLHLRLVTEGSGCHSGGSEMKQLVEDAIIDAAPDLTSLETELMTAAAEPVFVPLQGLKGRELSPEDSQVAVA